MWEHTVNVIADAINEWDTHYVEDAVFGTGDAYTIARLIDTFCATHLNSLIAEFLFYESSQGAVFGIKLDDARRVVIKIHQPDRSLAFLSAVYSVQRYLADHDYPCPKPLLAPTSVGKGLATIEELIDAGIYADAHNPAIRRMMAEKLAQLAISNVAIRNIAELSSNARGRQLPSGVLWPMPHSQIFDFAATAQGAEWIDDIARNARAMLAHVVGEPVIGHTDWSVKHFRFLNGNVRVIYDWDSLALERETIIVGEAARGFTMTWHFDVPITPTPDEARAFIEEYENCRGKSFTKVERATIAAAATYALAYSARCEHCLNPHSQDVAGSSSEALAKYGDSFIG